MHQCQGYVVEDVLLTADIARTQYHPESISAALAARLGDLVVLELESEPLDLPIPRYLHLSHTCGSLQDLYLIVLIEYHLHVEQDGLGKEELLLGGTALSQTELLESVDHVAVKDDICLEIGDDALLSEEVLNEAFVGGRDGGVPDLTFDLPADEAERRDTLAHE